MSALREWTEVLGLAVFMGAVAYLVSLALWDGSVVWPAFLAVVTVIALAVEKWRGGWHY